MFASVDSIVGVQLFCLIAVVVIGPMEAMIVFATLGARSARSVARLLAVEAEVKVMQSRVPSWIASIASCGRESTSVVW